MVTLPSPITFFTALRTLFEASTSSICFNIKTADKFDLSRQGVAEFDLDRCVGCGQCYIVCQDAGGQCIDWDYEKRRPVQDEKRCLSCMVCSFICPVSCPPLITYKEVKNKKPVIPSVSK